MTDTSPAKPTIRHYSTLRIVGSLAAMATAILLAQQGGQAMAGFGRGGWQTPAFAVPLHLATVLPALPLGLWILLRPKGDKPHRVLGRVWAMLMMITAIDTLLIRNISGGLNPIHIFSFVTMVSIPMGIWHARSGRIAQHRRAMFGPYVGLVVAGLFALVPGRMLGTMLFG